MDIFSFCQLLLIRNIFKPSKATAALHFRETDRKLRDSHIKKALLDFNNGVFFESANGLKFKNWCLSHVARSSSKAFLCKMNPKKGFKNSSSILPVICTQLCTRCKLIFVFNHLVAQSDGCLCKVLPLPLKDLPLLLQSLPLLPEALLLLKHVAIA